MCMPQLDPEFQVLAMKTLVELEQDWVPHAEGTSLYLRPTMIADGAELGVHPAHHFLYYIICSPSGSYYKNGMAPIRIHIEDRYVRAVKGGTGAAKTGGNYASSLKATFEAQAKGYDQVLWLDGKLVTAPTEGSILPGITRKSILQLAQEKGIPVEERPIAVEELFQAHAEGRLTEAFGTGTAAVISPVGELAYRDRSMILNEGKIGPVSQAMYDNLVGIQRGDLPDPHGWVYPIG